MIEIVIGMLILPVAKYIIGARVGKWLDRQIEAQPAKYERMKIIWDHHQKRAVGAGHQAKDILTCNETMCVTL